MDEEREVVKEGKRKSKDRKVNKKEKALVGFLEERGWDIINELIREDEDEEYTFTGWSRNTVMITW